MVSGGQVQGDLGSYESCMNDFKSQIGNLSSGWQGSSYDSFISQSEAFVGSYLSTVSGQMSSFASACDLYQEYEQCKSSLASAKNSYNQASSTNDSSSMTSYNTQIATYQTKLDNLKNQIEGLLASASSPVLEATSMSGATTTSTEASGLGTPTYGSLTEHTYNAPNGLSLKYYLYVPNYGQGEGNVTSGLPVMLYMHGGGNKNYYGSVLQRGLSKAISEKTTNPSGLVVIPYIQNFSDSRVVPALKSLMDDVVTTYKADTNRISVSGHSNGAITTYKMINAYPNYFAAAIPISGFQKVTDAFKYTKVWAFNGENDHGSSTSNTGAQQAVQAINSIGGSASLHTYKGYGHSYVQDFTYEQEFESPDGEVESPLEWAFRQKKSA